TTQLIRPEALGGIYRIRKTGMAKADDPRGLKLKWKEMQPRDLSKLLDDSRPFVRKRAVQTLADHPNAGDALFDTVSKGSPLARLMAVWTATRMDSEVGREVVRKILSHKDQDETVLQAAIHSVG